MMHAEGFMGETLVHGNEESVLDPNEPSELAKLIANKYSEADLERLTEKAAQDVVDKLDPVYKELSPYNTQFAFDPALYGARLALGLEPFMEKEGEQ